MRRTGRSCLGALARSEGFTMAELLVTVLLIGVGLAAVFSTLDFSRNLTTKSEAKDAAAQVGEKAIESMLSNSFTAMKLRTAPGTDADSYHPWSYVSGSSYRPDQMPGGSTATEPLVIDGAGTSGFERSDTWNVGRFSGTTYRFVTWVDDPVTGSTAQDQKRLTVAVTVNNQRVKPVLLSSVVAP